MGICWAGTPLRVRMLRKYLHKTKVEYGRGGAQFSPCVSGQHAAHSLLPQSCNVYSPRPAQPPTHSGPQRTHMPWGTTLRFCGICSTSRPELWLTMGTHTARASAGRLEPVGGGVSWRLAGGKGLIHTGLQHCRWRHTNCLAVGAAQPGVTLPLMRSRPAAHGLSSFTSISATCATHQRPGCG